MKRFWIILEYELGNYFKNKSFLITTGIVCVIAVCMMFLPRFVDLSDLLGTEKKNKSEGKEEVLVIHDSTGFVKESGAVEEAFSGYDIRYMDSRDEIEDELKDNSDIVGGFDITSLTEFEYLVEDSSIDDSKKTQFTAVMQMLNQYVYCANKGIDFNEIEIAFNPDINGTTTVLGKDMIKNFFYCYFLVILVFMIIIMYGTMVATSVTQEKSNRTIELLVTSTDTNSLFCAKVIAGTLAAVIQVGVIIITLLGSYGVNREYWGDKIDEILNIPANVLIAFAFFGLGGLLLYTFAYGAIGALVSKTEDINKSATSIQMIVMIVYFLTLFSLQNINGVVIKVLSFLPFSSYSSMFARIAMGKVAAWEVVVSYAILVVSVLGVGFLGAKIYRMGTLRYGNPIKITTAFKSLKKEKTF